MRARIIAIAAVLLTGAALTACGEDDAADFAKKVAMSDMYEVQAGQIAAQKGVSPAVKGFGQQMVDAHTKTTDQLKQAISASNLDVKLPTKLDDDHQDLIDDLNEANGEDFDDTYAKQQVDAHQDAIDLFQDYADNGDNKQLKSFASETLPTLKDHLQHAKQLPEGSAPAPEGGA